MRYFILVLTFGFAFVLADSASAQCGGGGGAGGGSAIASGGGGGSVSSGVLLTSPGSYYYGMMVAQQQRQAYLQQQSAIAYAQAAKKAERQSKIRASIIAQREKEQAEKMESYSPGYQLARK